MASFQINRDRVAVFKALIHRLYKLQEGGYVDSVFKLMDSERLVALAYMDFLCD